MKRMDAEIRRKIALGIALLALLILPGCGTEPPDFRMNRVFAHKMEIHGAELDTAIDDTQIAITQLFGTPDEPLLPAVLTENPDFQSLIQLENLQRAAGAVASDRDGTDRGLFRKHCSQCHGISGDGNGPASSLLNPYPRDFRMGVFKFKSTQYGAKPTVDDLVRTLRQGMPGTSMPSFHLYPAEDLTALAQYVIYLTLRGEVERAMYRDAANELGYGDPDQTPQDRLLAMELKESDPEAYQEQWDAIEDYVVAAASRWIDAPEQVVAIAPPPEKIPAWPLAADATADQQAEMAASIARGKALFGGKVANCAICHGADGRGDGQVNDYDDWTKEWTMRNGLDPKDPEKKQVVREYLALGAHKPRNILPRDMHAGAFRGGDQPQDIYRRIVQGIDGTPMPAINLVDQPSGSGLTTGDVWDIVHYVLSLSQTGRGEAL
ncbi:Cytochrome c [Rosistilla carotiformis]|uniref:Cytochrome c n=2 Tax=Rosistilla carotiformis TaxID=2528017 RepID=A0A518JYN1_9BACT|nr:Cytochrome c [Rosistilla carotiformis]